MEAPLLEIALAAEHVALGARMVPFAGFSMPVQYEGIKAEHEAVRTRAGLFDVSHMGELWLEGPNALATVDALVTNDVYSLSDGRALYTLCCNEAGAILDDLIVYRQREDKLLIVCNAGNLGKISAHVRAYAEGRCSFTDASPDTSLLALQGPKAEAILRALTSDSAPDLAPFHFAEAKVAGVPTLVARTGYTGEDGFEIFCANADAKTLFSALLAAGEAHGLAPAGLGCRDTLRLEAKLPLYGNDIDETTNAFEAGLGWVIKLETPRDFIGKDALIAMKARGLSSKLVGIEMTGRGIARHGYPVVSEGEAVGVVTSGSPAPTVGKNIGLAYVPVALSAVGTVIGVDIRGKTIEAVVAKTPFYKRGTGAA